MKKSTKLLSVILAIVMIFSSLSVASFAAKAKYKTVAELEALNAYDQYGQVTRLSTEERMSMILDSLDDLLAPLTSLNMGEVFNVLGLSVTINITSVNGICSTLDSLYNTMGNGLYSIAKGIVDLGIVEDLNIRNSWKTGMTRENTAQLTIIQTLLNVVSDNGDAINSVLTDGIQLGLIGNFIKGLDLRDINALVKDVPGALKKAIFPLMARPDDVAADRTKWTNTAGNGGVLTVLDDFVKGIFTKPMNWTSYRVDATGNDLGYTTTLPTTANTTSRYFVVNGDTITQYDYNYAPLMGSSDETGTWTETVTYTKAQEFEGSETYLFKAPEGYDGDQTLKWYKSGDEGYFLPSVRDAIEAGTLDFTLTGSGDSVVTLLYKFIPYVFAEMAPVVLNGSVKKALAGAFDVEFTEMTAEEITAAAAATGDPDNFFTKDQEFYLWEYSDYKVIEGVPYYRFQDQYFIGEVPQNISTYYSMFDWDWHVSDDFVNKYIPKVDGLTVSASDAGYTTVLAALNTFVYDVIDLVLVDSFEVKGVTYDLKNGMGWQNGGLDKVVDNVVRAARFVFNIAPAEIFDEYYNDAKLSPYYNMMMNGTTKQALVGVIAAAVKMIMPQVQFPKEAQLCETVGTDSVNDVQFAALGAIVVRELCTQLMPAYNFDALIYADYNTKTLLKGASYNNEYWLDTILLMGLDLGMYYLRNITDIGEDDLTNGYYGAMKNLGAVPSTDASAFTYAAGATYVDSIPNWQYKVDWVIDWALTSSQEWAWGFEKMIDCGSTVSLATYENPWNKLNKVFLDLLPLDQLLNDSGASSASGTWLENVLREKFVESILNLDLPTLQSALVVPNGVFRNGAITTQVVTVVRGLLNDILYKIAGNVTIVSDTTYTTVDAILNQTNIKNLLVRIIGYIDDAGRNGLLVPVLPIVNMFLGWNTGIQSYADPNIYFVGERGDNYLLQSVSNTIKFTNKSSGMLQKHRNDGATDQPYTITVKNVVCDNANVTISGFPVDVAPSGTADLTLSLPAINETVKFTVTYAYKGKDGQALGGDLTKVMYGYVSTTEDQENVEGRESGDDDKDYAGIDQWMKYQFTKDIFGTVTNYMPKIFTTGAITGMKDINLQSVTAPDSNKNMNTLAATYFQFANKTTSKWPSKIAQKTSGSGYLWLAKSGVTADTDFPYGLYDMGRVAVKYKSTAVFSSGDSKVWEIDYIYYNDYDIQEVMDKYVGYDFQASDFSDSAAWARYEAALKDIVKLATYPKLTNYVDTIQPLIPDAITEIDAAYEALIGSRTTTTTTVDSLIAALDTCEPNKAKDIDFEDNELYEYFQYEKQRTSARNVIKSYQMPAEPESYIEGESLSQAAIEAMLAAVDNANIKTGVNATVTAPSEEAMNAWRTACADWKAPTMSDIAMADEISRLNYYYTFMHANPRANVTNQFLTKEIAAAAAQGYKQADYSVDSWKAYSDALAEAQAVAAKGSSALQSEIFDAKYSLMKAQNELIPAYASMKDNGYLDTEIAGLIEQANTIVEHFGDYFAVKDGVEAVDAWEQLVRALGVEYDVTVDGVDYEGILYDHSALTFTAYDRINSAKEQAKVDRACDKLQAAIDNFVCSITVDSNDDGVVNQVEQEVRYIQGITPGSIANGAALLTHVRASNPAANLTVAVSKANAFGTGAKVDVAVDGIGVLTTYLVVIYGDVNGDGAVDAFDAFAVDKDFNNIEFLDGVYATAADTTADGDVTVADFSAIMSAAVGNADAVSQVR